MHQNRFRLGLRPRPRWRSLQRSPRPLSWIKEGLLLREGEGIWERRRRGGKGEDLGGEGREGRGWEDKGGDSQYFIAPQFQFSRNMPDAWCGKMTPIYKIWRRQREIFGVNRMNAEVFYER